MNDKTCWGCSSISIKSEHGRHLGWCERVGKEIRNMKEPICEDVGELFR